MAEDGEIGRNMHRFFADLVQSADERIILSGENARHAALVLRLSPGDEIMVGSGDGRDYSCKIESITAEEVVAEILDISGNAAELPVEITLFQGFPKGDKLDLIIQKSVELGVHRIIPVWMSRSIVKMDEAKAKKRRDRYQSISEAAAKQSGRGIIPEIGAFLSMKEAVKKAVKLDRILLPYENAKGMEYTRKVLSEIRDENEKGTVKSLGIFIGPEGGFEESEVTALQEIGAEVITLGHRILRTETAGMTMMSILSYILEKD